MRFFDYLNTVPKWLGFVVSIGFMACYHLAAMIFGFSITIGWLWLLLIAGGFVAGLRLSILLSVIISFYTLYAIAGDASRSIQVVIGTILVAVLVGYYSRYQEYNLNRARAAWEETETARREAEKNAEAHKYLVELNGNIKKVREARVDLDAIWNNYNLPDNVRVQLREVINLLANLELASSGWQALYKITEEVREARAEIGKKMRHGLE